MHSIDTTFNAGVSVITNPQQLTMDSFWRRGSDDPNNFLGSGYGNRPVYFAKATATPAERLQVWERPEEEWGDDVFHFVHFGGIGRSECEFWS